LIYIPNTNLKFYTVAKESNIFRKGKKAKGKKMENEVVDSDE